MIRDSPSIACPRRLAAGDCMLVVEEHRDRRRRARVRDRAAGSSRCYCARRSSRAKVLRVPRERSQRPCARHVRLTCSEKAQEVREWVAEPSAWSLRQRNRHSRHSWVRGTAALRSAAKHRRCLQCIDKRAVLTLSPREGDCLAISGRTQSGRGNDTIFGSVVFQSLAFARLEVMFDNRFSREEGEPMLRLIVMYAAALCALHVSACATDASVGSSADTATQAVTTMPIDHTFANGCRVIFWCHTDQAGGRPAFCKLGGCDNSTSVRVSSFCGVTCSSDTSCSIDNIQNFGPCN